MKKIRNSFLIVSLVFILASCGEIETLPEIPRIEFTSFTIFDTTDILGNKGKGGRLKFYFEDGDGNIGLQAPGPGEESDSTNLFFSLLRVIDGEVVVAPDNDPLRPTAYRIPYMERTGQNTILQGTIAVTFLYNFYSAEDTIRYEFYLKDRDDNLSNTVTTKDIAVSENGVYK